MATVSTVPANSNAVADAPSLYERSDSIDNPNHFVARNSRVLNARKNAFLRDRVAVAHSTRLDFDSHQSRAGVLDLLFDQLERAFGVRHLNSAHIDLHRTARARTWR
jgi:hypothetical protein